MTLRKRAFAFGALATGAALALAGCSGSSNPGDTPKADDVSGTVNVAGAFTGPQGTAMQNDLNAWAKAKYPKLTVNYKGDSNFQTSIVAQVKGGTPPDIAIFPQPGVAKSLISSGIVPLEQLMDVKQITSDEANGLANIAKVDGKTYALPFNINVKSIVWYNPAAFKKAGLTVPTTDDELVALQKKVIDEKLGYPWCVGIASKGSNGWPMTDWLEEYVLRYGGLDQYNDWITHKIKFDSPLVKKAAAKVESLIFAKDAVDGGGKAMASIDFGAAGNNLFKTGGKSAGQCFMMRQGTFITGFFPKDIQDQINKGDLANINAFVLPTPTGATTGTLGGGDIVSAFKNTASVKAVATYLASKEFGTYAYAKQWSSALSPHKDFDASLYATPFQAVAAKAVASAQIFGFDASDQMPGSVGAGTEWSNLTQWTAGQQSLDAALKAIDASWPQ